MNNYVAWPIEFPAVPRGAARVRLCFHAENTIAEVDGLVSTIGSWLKARVKAQGKQQLVEDLVAELQVQIAMRKEKDLPVITQREVNGEYTNGEYESGDDALMGRRGILQEV